MEGIIPLYKPKGITSHDCVSKLRKILNTKRVGHTGTLDPEVDGVLPICIGRATKVAEYVSDAGKTYEGEVTIGFSTTTEDKTGEIVEKRVVKEPINRQTIEGVLKQLTGKITQTPPMYSAVKVKGKKLYEYARQGLTVERPSRKVTIYSLQLLDEREFFQGDTVSFRIHVSCSKGTYIRTLAVMIGEQLGYPAHMSQLTRTQVAAFSLDDCVTIEEVEKKVADGQINDVLKPLETALYHLPKYIISDKLIEKVKNGAILQIPDELKDVSGPIVMEAECGKAIAIYEKHPTKGDYIKPKKVLRNNQVF